MLKYVKINYPNELLKIKNMLQNFDMEQYITFIEDLPLISSIRKDFLITLIEFRRSKILQFVEGD